MRVALAIAAALLLAGCPKPAPAPTLDGTWPAAAGDYATVSESWTRGGKLRAEYQLVAEVHVTIKSPPWRAAYVERQTRKLKLGTASRAELDAEQRQAESEAFEVVVILTTWDRRENDLDRGERSVWRLVMVDAEGNEIEPVEIKRDRRPEYVVRSEFPDFGDFSRAYVVKFPRDARLLGAGVDKIALRLSSSRGGIELTWQGAR
jgi:hypothetical protein